MARKKSKDNLRAISFLSGRLLERRAPQMINEFANRGKKAKKGARKRGHK
jgi:hypothetical protein